MRKIGKMGRISKYLLLPLILLISSIYAQPRISASIDAKQVLVQDSFSWTLSVEGSEDMPQVHLPEIKKVARLSGPMQSSNYTYVNGKMSSKKTLTYTFVALEPGKVTIPPVQVILGKKSYLTKALNFVIVAAKGKTGAASQTVFLRAIPSKTKIYIGEPITVRYKLFTKVGVYNYQVSKLPDAVGFWAEEVPQASQPRLVSEVVNGVRYNTAVLKTVLYYPTRSGELIIDPLKTELEIEVKSKQNNRRAFNDPFFNDPFFGGNRKATRDFLSNQVKISVTSLPDPRPANFSGAVGKFQIRASLDTNAVFANDAVGLSITLKGTGNFKSLKLPVPNLPDDIDVFKPERSETIKIKGKTHSGYKKSTYLLVPREPGNVVIDPIEFTYFDLQAKKYITKSSGWIKLSVYDAEGTQPVVTSGYSREEVALMQEDIRYIKSPDTHEINRQSEIFGFLYWGIHIIGIMVLIGGFGLEYRSQQLHGNANLRRSIKAMGKARKKLKQAERLAEDSPELRAILQQCIAGFIGARLDAAENALNTSELIEVLHKKGVAEDIIEETDQFLEGMTLDRFAPGAVQRSASEWIQVTRDLLQRLGRVL